MVYFGFVLGLPLALYLSVAVHQVLDPGFQSVSESLLSLVFAEQAFLGVLHGIPVKSNTVGI